VIAKTVFVGCVPVKRERVAVSVAERVSESVQPSVAVLNSPVVSIVRSPSTFSQLGPPIRTDAEN
jgi:hypothetical protein